MITVCATTTVCLPRVSWSLNHSLGATPKLDSFSLAAKIGSAEPVRIIFKYNINFRFSLVWEIKAPCSDFGQVKMDKHTFDDFQLVSLIKMY